ncbi:MAG: alpha/beta hydrolase [Betaproteobacteria bacterium]
MTLSDRISLSAPLCQVGTPLGRISYQQAGSGERVCVLLHGIGSASGSWQAQLDAAHGRPDLRLLAWDAPGYGLSAPVADDHPDADAYAQRLWAWLDALQVRGPVVLVGHSLGAIMAARAAVQQSARVQRLLLLSPARGYGEAAQDERERVLTQRLGQLAQLGPQGLAQARAAAMLSDRARPEWVEQVRQQMASIHPAGYTQAVHLLLGAVVSRDLLSLRDCGLTVEVASGEADNITPPAACDKVAQSAGVPRLSLGPVGHACAIEAAAAVIGLIDRCDGVEAR